MGELKFNNLTVLYNKDTDFSKKNMKKIHLLENLIVLIGVAVAFVIIFIGVTIGGIAHFIFTIISIIILIIAIAFAFLHLSNKVAPKNYYFIQYIRKVKHDDIEVGWFNGRYIALIYSENSGWKARGLKGFIYREDYVLTDNSKKDKPIHMTIDTTKEVIEITVENVEEKHGESN